MPKHIVLKLKCSYFKEHFIKRLTPNCRTGFQIANQKGMWVLLLAALFSAITPVRIISGNDVLLRTGEDRWSTNADDGR